MSFRGALDDVPSVMLLMNCHRWVVITLNPEPSTRALPLDTPWGLLCPRLPMPPYLQILATCTTESGCSAEDRYSVVSVSGFWLESASFVSLIYSFTQSIEKISGQKRKLDSVYCASVFVEKSYCFPQFCKFRSIHWFQKGETRRLAVTSST